MTQKSHARKMRDAAKERAKEQLATNTCWDDLNGIYQDTARLLHSHTNIASFAADRDLHRYLQNPTLTVANLKSLGRDLRQLSQELANIHAEHAGKTGGSDDVDEVYSTFSIFEKYNLFTERHNAVVMPTAYQIVEEFAQAEERRKLARGDAQQQAEQAGPTGDDASAAPTPERTQVQVQLDENDPNPQASVEQAQAEVVSQRGVTSAIKVIEEDGTTSWAPPENKLH